MARSPLFHGDIPGTWGTAECLIFMPAVLRAPGPTLSLTTHPVEAVYSPGTYFTLGDNKSRWTTLLELNRVERNRYVRNVVKQGIALRTRIIALPTCQQGTYKVQHVMAVRRKYRCHWSSLPVDLWYRMTYSWSRVTDCPDRNHEEVSGCINLREGKKDFVWKYCFWDMFTFILREDWWLWYIFQHICQDV